MREGNGFLVITYNAARLAIFAHLESLGWEVKRGLKVPQAIVPSGSKLYFQAQAVYLNAHSMHVDIRTMTPEAFVNAVHEWDR